MVGISGMGMLPLAIYLAQSGETVVGMDENVRPEVASILEKNGIKIDSTNQIPEICHYIIYSSAIYPDNSILLEAKKRGIPSIRRGHYLEQITKDKKLIAVVGSHGKTTTVAMLIHALRRSGFDFSFFLGALFCDSTIFPAHYSDSDWVVAEVDESDGTIDSFSPAITLVVNFDWDHPTQYASAEDLEKTFSDLFKRTSQAVFIPKDCRYLDKLIKNEPPCKVFTYGQSGGFQGIPRIEPSGKTTLSTNGTLPQMECLIPNHGLFNAHNGLAALSVVHFLLNKLPMDPFKDFLGVRRRQENLYQSENFKVMMDYAHHPTEIQALLDYVRATSMHKCLVIFQPHRYTRTQAYYKDFARVLNIADRVILLPVYSASENFLAAGTSQKIADAFPEPKNKLTLIEYSQQRLLKELPVDGHQESVNILFVGAGDIEMLALNYKKQLVWADWWRSFSRTLDSATNATQNEPLAPKTTLGLGGSARFYIEPASLDDLIRSIVEARALQCPVFTLGRGSNLVVPDEGFKGLVIRLNHPHWKEIRDLGSGRLLVGAGARLKEICGYACKLGLGGFEFLEGIPGSLGGALRMNAGAMGGSLFDIIEGIKFLTEDGDIKEFPTESLMLGYRFCKNLENALAISAVLKSPQLQNRQLIREKINEFAGKRKITQPREPSAGCIFKNPEGNCAGRLIEASGLKGFSVGAAEVSCVHGNFIINRGGATSRNIVDLVRVIRESVYKRNGIHLEPEVLFLGKNWDEELATKEGEIVYPNNG